MGEPAKENIYEQNLVQFTDDELIMLAFMWSEFNQVFILSTKDETIKLLMDVSPRLAKVMHTIGNLTVAASLLWPEHKVKAEITRRDLAYDPRAWEAASAIVDKIKDVIK